MLLADNNKIFLEGLAKLLESESGIEVVCACCAGLEAVEGACKHQPDVALIDTELSECSGVETVRRIHEASPEMHIMVLSHSEADEDLISAARAGAKAYLSKDVSVGSLIKAIALVVEGGVVISPPMAERLLAEFNALEEAKETEKLVALLSRREEAILSLVAKGLTNREVATNLCISENTVKVHMRNIMEKLHARTRQQAVSLAGGKTLLLGV